MAYAGTGQLNAMKEGLPRGSLSPVTPTHERWCG